MLEPGKNDSGPRDETNYVTAALKWQYNWIGLLGAAAFAIVSGTGLPLVLAAGLELIYVAVVPQSSRFRRLVRSWQFAEEKKRHEQKMRQMLFELPPPVQQRYAAVQQVVQQIRTNYDRLSSSSQIFVGQAEEKFRWLLYGYLRLLQSAFQQRQYVQTCDANTIMTEIKQLEGTLARETPKVQEINRKRIEILKKRLEKFEKIRENWRVVEAQCSAIQDVLALIRDQSMTMRDPQELTDRLDTLVQDVEQTETAVREFEAMFDMGMSDIPDMMPLSGDEVRSSSRNRQRS